MLLMEQKVLIFYLQYLHLYFEGMETSMEHSRNGQMPHNIAFIGSANLGNKLIYSFSIKQQHCAVTLTRVTKVQCKCRLCVL